MVPGVPRLPWLQLAADRPGGAVRPDGRSIGRRGQRPPLASTMDTLVSLGTLVAYWPGRWCSCSRAGCTSTSRWPRPSPRSCCSAASSRRGRRPGPVRPCTRCSSSGRRGRRARRRHRAGGRRRRAATGDALAGAPRRAGGHRRRRGRGRAARSTSRWSPARACRSTVGRATRSSAATLNADGRLVVEVTRIGRDTAAGPDRRPVRTPSPQGADAAARRPDLRGLRAGRAGDGGADLRGLAAGRRPDRRRSPRRWPCW